MKKQPLLLFSYRILITGSAALCCLLFLTLQVQAQIRYVKPVASGLGNGTSWANASSNLQGMITASSSGQQVWVAAGTYKPTTGTSRTATFTLKNGVAVYGGFNGTETMLSQRDYVTNVTILSGEIGALGDADNSYHVVTGAGGSSTRLDGFSITGGNANGGGTNQNNGGGIINTAGFLQNTSPTYANCNITGNRASNNGGGMYCVSTLGAANPTLINCTIIGNSATNGGGNYNGALLGLTSPAFTNCSFEANTATGNGGGMCNEAAVGGVITTISNNVFFNNMATGNGGGIYNGALGAAVTPSIVNSTFKDNTAAGGGGMHNTGAPAPAPNVKNCILWGNSSGINNTSSNVTYSIVQGGHAGMGNVNSDPLFVSATDLHLLYCSPAIDAASSTGSPATPAADKEGMPRFNAIVNNSLDVDMGAFEYQGPQVLTDIDMDGYADCDNRPDDDCNDMDSAINPGAQEICDLLDVDEDCDGLADDADPSAIGQTPFYPDNDGDGHGDETASAELFCDAPAGYVANNDDCDDGDPERFPGNPEVCDDKDNDCNMLVDDGLLFQNWYYDGDDDGYGAGPPVYECAPPVPGDWVLLSGDCDDMNPAVNPGAQEICNYIDDDCDNLIDENVKTTFYRDFDGDGHGNPNISIQECIQPPGYVLIGDDCNDTNNRMFPGNLEVCDAYDNDCDGQVNEDVLLVFYFDADGDGFGDPSKPIQHCDPPPGYVPNNLDCNDNNAAVNPGAMEVCNGFDDNCNGFTDDNDVTLVDNQPPTVTCKPFTAILNPNGQKSITVSDVLAAYTDNCFIVTFSLNKTSFNCSNIGMNTVLLVARDRKHNTASCNATVTVVDNTPPMVSCKNVNVDLDETGQASIVTADVLVSATDGCGGNIMLSLSKSQFDCGDAGPNQVMLTATDNQGNSSSCTAIVNAIGNPDLANDNEEICNGKDDNCNGQVDEGFDADGDGFSSCGGDCDDNEPSIHPNAEELCNEIDDNCDGQVDESFDLDRDGFTVCEGDCNDMNPTVHPNTVEVCNGRDENCNGLIDEDLFGLFFLGNVTLTTQTQVNAWRPCYSVIQGNLTIQGLSQNDPIVDLSPLANITKIVRSGINKGNLEIKATKLTNLHGLENLTSIDGYLLVQFNGQLTTLDGLDNLANIGSAGSAINQNKSGLSIGLSDCCAVYPFVVSGRINNGVFSNRPGCNTLAEILMACGTDPLIVTPANGSGLPGNEVSMELQPNPAGDEVTLEFRGLDKQVVNLFIYDNLGKIVMNRDLDQGQSSLKLVLDENLFKNGLYTVNAVIEGQTITKRLVVAR